MIFKVVKKVYLNILIFYFINSIDSNYYGDHESYINDDSGITIIIIDENFFVKRYKMIEDFFVSIFALIFSLEKIKSKLICIGTIYLLVGFYIDACIKNVFKNPFFNILLFDDVAINVMMSDVQSFSLYEYIDLFSLCNNVKVIYDYYFFLVFFSIIPVFFNNIKFAIYHKTKIKHNFFLLKKKLYGRCKKK